MEASRHLLAFLFISSSNLPPMKRSLSCLLLLGLVSCGNKDAYKAPEDPLFLRMEPGQTGLDFVNKVQDSKDFNVFNYRNFYNGGGAAIGDINNDGLADVYLTANQSINHLYLNKGNWKFEDITESAGVGGTQNWSTGVAMADVNGDGWLDIYVCNSGDVASKSRNNELFINQKNGTFKESAADYGLQDPDGLSTHAAFFDYDEDGDLDCYILNNSYRPIESFGYNRNQRSKRDKKGGDKLFRNDNGHFTDVSAEAGIYGSEIGFGLGVTIGDLNGDKWPDIYVSNDFFERDYLYLNQQNGTFKEVLEDEIGHISLSSMGSDMGDINNDGLLDIFTTDMLPESDYRLKTTTKFDEFDVFNAKLKNDFHHQFTRNMLQLNNGDNTFTEIGQLAGVYQTDWSWGALMFDFQNDGWKDILVCNGISKDLTDQDFIDFMASEESIKRVKEQQSFNFAEFLSEMKSTKFSNYGFVNQKDLHFKNEAQNLGLAEPSFSNGAAYGDLDNDGDLDVVINNENMDCFVYRNQAREKTKNHFLEVKLNGEGMNRFGIGAELTVYAKDSKQVMQVMTSRGFQSSVQPIAHFGLGAITKIDSLRIIWPTRKVQVLHSMPVDTILTLGESNAGGSYVPKIETIRPLLADVTATCIKGDAEHKENVYVDFDNERLMPWLMSIEGPKCASGDINGDGLIDVVIGGSKGDELKMLIAQRDGKYLVKTSPGIQSSKSLFEDIGIELLDIDNDKDLDLLVSSGGNETGDGSYSPHLLRAFLNDGKGEFVTAGKSFPIVSTNSSVVRAGDFDHDGDTDVFVGGRSVPGSYGKPPRSFLFRNDGNGTFTNVSLTVGKQLQQAGMVTDATFADVNGDGISELIVCGDWMPIAIFSWNGTAMIRKNLPDTEGWWNVVKAQDLDGDGDIDLVAGNMGLNTKFKASTATPVNMYVSDFDNNGQSECILSYYKTDGLAYPLPLRGEIVSQLPSLKKRFLKYSDYGGKTIEQVLTEEERSKALTLSVRSSVSTVFINDGKGAFTAMSLPVEAQLSPVRAIIAEDLDGDGFRDLLLAGNFSGVRPEIGGYDGNYGQLFLGDGKNHFRFVPNIKSGLSIRGEARDAVLLNGANGKKRILVTMNNARPYIFETK